ncbi:MAG: ATP-binding protein [candidate division KSB1 bacterium]|jgi:anti-sigma regulatory factor (Ser/Thr protein kinase)/anti-anti-sigma regulatory factor|nr:ATP-binding protein [candidate division KSB1 bacterium]
MSESLVKIQRTGSNDEIVHLILQRGAELPSAIPTVEKTILECIAKRDLQIVVNMAHVSLPPARFIAMLLETTCQVRRLGGDVKLVNVSNSVRNNLMTFSAVTYLSLEETESYALKEFDADIVILPDKPEKKTVKTRASSSGNKATPTPNIHEAHASAIDIEIEAIAEDSIRVGSTVDSLYELCDFVTHYANQAGMDQKEIGKVKVTVYEACLNVVEHAYFSNPDNSIETEVRYDKEKFIIIIRDWGESFEFDPDREYDVEMAVKDRKTGGFGLHIIKRTVDAIDYVADSESGNTLILLKYL